MSRTCAECWNFENLPTGSGLCNAVLPLWVTSHDKGVEPDMGADFCGAFEPITAPRPKLAPATSTRSPIDGDELVAIANDFSDWEDGLTSTRLWCAIQGEFHEVLARLDEFIHRRGLNPADMPDAKSRTERDKK